MQEVITYIILVAAVAFVVVRMVNILRGKHPDCGCGQGRHCRNQHNDLKITSKEKY